MIKIPEHTSRQIKGRKTGKPGRPSRAHIEKFARDLKERADKILENHKIKNLLERAPKEIKLSGDLKINTITVSKNLASHGELGLLIFTKKQRSEIKNLPLFNKILEEHKEVIKRERQETKY